MICWAGKFCEYQNFNPSHVTNVQSFKPLLLFNKLHCVTNCSVFITQWVIDCTRTIIKGNLSRSCNIMSICYLVQSKQCFSERSAKSNRNIRHKFHSTSNCRVTLTTGNQTNSCNGEQILLQDLHTNVVWKQTEKILLRLCKNIDTSIRFNRDFINIFRTKVKLIFKHRQSFLKWTFLHIVQLGRQNQSCIWSLCLAPVP